MRDEPLVRQRSDNLADQPLVRLAVRRVACDENVNVARVCFSTAVRAHDLDEDLVVDGQRLGTDRLEKLATLLPRDSRAEIVV